MNLDPTLRTFDRMGSFVVGLGCATYAVFGGLEQMIVRAGLLLIGVAFVVGGIGGQ